MTIRRVLLRGALIVMCMSAVGRAEAALDMVLNIPGIPGDSVVPGYEGQITVLAWSWGASSSATTCGPGSTISLQDLNVTKYLDVATNPLTAALKNSTVLPSATLTILPAGGGQPTQTIALSAFRVTSYSTGGSGGESRLTDNVSFNFSQAVITYYFVDGKGGNTSNSVTVTAGCP